MCRQQGQPWIRQMGKSAGQCFNKKNELLLPFKALYGYNSITQTAVINIFEIRV